MAYRILVADEDDAYRRLIARLLGSEGCEVLTAADVAACRELLTEDVYDVVIAERSFGDGGVAGIVSEARRKGDDTAVVIISTHATAESLLEAMRLGVADYITKPFGVDEFLALIRQVLQTRSVQKQKRELLVRLTERVAVLESLATRDSVTELFNHAYLQDALEAEIRRAGRTETPLSVMLVGIDEFKRLNESEGYEVGDRALRQIARLMESDARSSDLPFRLQPEGVAARYGGDEFMIVLPNTPKAGAATRAERLRWTVEGHDFGATRLPAMTVSIGVSTYPDDGRDREELLGSARTALEVAKGRGRNAVSSYSPQMRQVTAHEPELSREERERVAAFEQVVAEEAFSMVFQPIVSCSAGSIVGYEAFFRPKVPQFPNAPSFFATAQALGRVLEVGRVIRKACGRAAEELPDGCLLFINIHPFELADPVLLAGDPGLVAHAKRVVFEVVETEAIADLSRASKQMQRVRRLGFRFALDDLGSGYAGLNHLAQLYPDFVKIDMNLVRQLDGDARTARLLKHILEFSAGEGMDVIIEGIETCEQRDAVMSLGGRLMQGYLFARPHSEFTRVVSGIDPSEDPSGGAVGHSAASPM